MLNRKQSFQSTTNVKPNSKDTSISLDHLKTWNPQNFTSILNFPNVSILNLTQKSLLKGFKRNNNDNRPKELDISKDFDKYIDFSISTQLSPRSTQSQHKTLRDYIHEGYDGYINKIKQAYPAYKMNHNKRIEARNNPLENEQLMLYQQSSKIFTILPSEYFLDTYTINKEILEKKREELEMMIREVYNVLIYLVD